MSNKKNLSQLTRSLRVGASAGSIALVTVGCAPVADFFNISKSGFGSFGVFSSEAERAACAQAQSTKSARDVNQLLVTAPSGRCVAPVINSLSPQTLAALSPAALTGLSDEVVGRFSPRVLSQLPASAQTEVRAAFTRAQLRRSDQNDNDGDDGGSGY